MCPSRLTYGDMPVRLPKQTIWYVHCFLIGILVSDLCASSPSESDRDQSAVAIVQTAQDLTDAAQVKALPDFTSIEDTELRKKQFFEFMQPLIQAENSRIKEKRLRIIKLYEALENGQELSVHDRRWLQEQRDRYRVSSTDVSAEDTFHQLLTYVDTVPLELALAQAANESAWGRSKFARKGNNIFGERCVKEGCGIVPTRRARDAMYEVTFFDLPTHSVRSYMHNLNSHPAYHPFRILRYEKRRAGERPDGYTLAVGLQEYSETGMDYVHRIRAIMRQNRDLISIPEQERRTTEHGQTTNDGGSSVWVRHPLDIRAPSAGRTAKNTSSL